MRLIRLHANQREEIEALFSGEIGAIAGIKGVSTGDTLCAEQKPIALERIVFPEPVVSMAIEPKTQADKDKMKAALADLSEEDPTFRVGKDVETGRRSSRGWANCIWKSCATGCCGSSRWGRTRGGRWWRTARRSREAGRAEFVVRPGAGRQAPFRDGGHCLGKK
jgi:hypothetical protein